MIDTTIEIKKHQARRKTLYAVPIVVGFRQQKNFTICVILDDHNRIKGIGISKRNAETDKPNDDVGQRVALWRALDQYIEF